MPILAIEGVPMYFLNDPLVEYAIDYFKEMDCAAGDAFWRLFPPGNTVPHSDRPFERLSDYEAMLELLARTDLNRYKQLHKGTPFYFMSWLAFDLRIYKKGLFYIDAAISEDVRQAERSANPDAWKALPAAKFLLLKLDDSVAHRAIRRVLNGFSGILLRFPGVTKRQHIGWPELTKFVNNFLSDSTQRTVISALYVFILEFSENHQQLSHRRGSSGGSNEPFTIHLFTGGLLLESLLKHYYPEPAGHQGNYTIGTVLNRADFLADFGLAHAPSTSADTLREIYDAIQGSNSVETAFSTAAKLRNTTGHNLVWDNVFDTPDIYLELFDQVMNAVLYVVDAKGR
jgi:hypothetical protein